MKTLRAVQILLVAAVAACTTDTRKQLDRLTYVDSVRVDSLENVRQELLAALSTSAEFMNDINSELAKARFLVTTPTVMSTAEIPDPNLERNEAVMKIGRLVARLDSVQTRLATARATVSQFSKKDSALLVKVADYEKTIGELQQAAEAQRDELQGQALQVAGLTTEVNTLMQHKAALSDSVERLMTEKNTAYVVIGTKAELIKKGVLVAEGSRRFVVAGSRPVKPARTLDPSAFTRLDRTIDRTIILPVGKYEIVSRQNPAFASPVPKDGKVSGVMTIEQPEHFWETSPYLIIVRN